MKAVFIRRYGGPEVLEYGEFPDPVVGAGDVLVKVAAAAINPIDIMERSGLTKDFKPISFPACWDGTCRGPSSVGPGAVGFSVGDRVLAWAYHTYADSAPSRRSFSPKSRTAWTSSKRLHCRWYDHGNQLISVAAEIKAGETVLVAGAFGGVGRSAVFTAKDRGARVIAGVLKKQLAAAQASAPTRSWRSTMRTR